MNNFALKKVKTGFHNQHIHSISGATWSSSKASFSASKIKRDFFCQTDKMFLNTGVCIIGRIDTKTINISEQPLIPYIIKWNCACLYCIFKFVALSVQVASEFSLFTKANCSTSLNHVFIRLLNKNQIIYNLEVCFKKSGVYIQL